MELTLVYTIIGFGLAGYSVIANDSIQTLGTFIASKQKWFKWYTLASAASLVMIFAITWGWYSYDGDISYGRLTRIPYQEIQWYHAVAPGILLLLTRIGIPVSTTFLVLSAFASTIVLEITIQNRLEDQKLLPSKIRRTARSTCQIQPHRIQPRAQFKNSARWTT